MIVENLSKAAVGDIYSFDYKQPHGGETHRHLAEIVAVRKLTESDIKRLESESDWRRGDPLFKRTETIVTCKMPDGGYRSFYAERTENCWSSLLGWFLFRTGLARLVFRSKAI